MASDTKTSACGIEIVSSRIFNAPRERVFEAFSDPDHLVHWWGPRGFTNTFTQFDLRPGGAWQFTMHGPNNIDYTNEKHFVEVVTPERIVFNHLGPLHQFKMTMLYAKQNDKTELTWKMVFDSPEEAENLRKFIAEANEQNFDRLEAYLAKTENTITMKED